ncbi:ATP synthase F(0) complex subunit j, mitochondrial [Denticeps clupeoides]|uniref:ATP synthase F(0) complex subunit j, mitochondrial n=1 Tax=Denticeps clupeoides TaxID=299321 RepID=UPI0010A45C87|nr:ATP synthase subunit ATP5MPL, mitochondrial [Denticeps clupeoides]
MVSGAFAGWWAKMSPYYTKAYQEMWVGVGLMTFLYYKVSYGGKKAVKSSADHVKSESSHSAKAAERGSQQRGPNAAQVGDITTSHILEMQHKNLLLEERKLGLEIEKLELEKLKLRSDLHLKP